jgi:hypothetical protein
MRPRLSSTSRWLIDVGELDVGGFECGDHFRYGFLARLKSFDSRLGKARPTQVSAESSRAAPAHLWFEQSTSL